MIRRLVLGLLAAAAMAATASAAPPTKAELMAQAVAGAAICADAMPSVKTTGDALKAKGFEFVHANGKHRIYTAMGKRVLVAITTAGSQSNGCFVMTSKMAPAEAEALIGPWLSMAQAQPVAGLSGLDKGWVGNFKGAPMQLGVVNHVDFGIVRGAAIVARAQKQ